jgi:hypothetical protein
VDEFVPSLAELKGDLSGCTKIQVPDEKGVQHQFLDFMWNFQYWSSIELCEKVLTPYYSDWVKQYSRKRLTSSLAYQRVAGHIK